MEIDRRQALFVGAGAGRAGGAGLGRRRRRRRRPRRHPTAPGRIAARGRRESAAGSIYRDGVFSGRGLGLSASRAGREAHFFLLGEQHGIAENPQLRRRLVPGAGRLPAMPSVAVEISPPMAAEIDRALSRGRLGRACARLFADPRRAGRLLRHARGGRMAGGGARRAARAAGPSSGAAIMKSAPTAI